MKEAQKKKKPLETVTKNARYFEKVKIYCDTLDSYGELSTAEFRKKYQELTLKYPNFNTIFKSLQFSPTQKAKIERFLHNMTMEDSRKRRRFARVYKDDIQP
jgi:hypothetical protein